jgi:hypothetical protein
MELNEHLRQMLKELGQAINESISGSGRVHDSIQRIRDEGYNLYMVLDAKVGVNKRERSGRKKAGASRDGGASRARTEEPLVEEHAASAAFRINVKDLRFLKSLGIDPTRKVRSVRAAGRRRTATSPTPARRSVRSRA